MEPQTKLTFTDCFRCATDYLLKSMNSIALPFYQQLLARLNQMPIQGNRHKMAVYANLNPDQPASRKGSMEPNEDNMVFAFHII